MTQRGFEPMKKKKRPLRPIVDPAQNDFFWTLRCPVCGQESSLDLWWDLDCDCADQADPASITE